MLKFAIALLGALLIMAALAPHGSRTGRIQTIPATATAQLDLFHLLPGAFLFQAALVVPSNGPPRAPSRHQIEHNRNFHCAVHLQQTTVQYA
jgi:hypothetical protein